VYALDRRIRYDEIKDVEKQGMERAYRPRYQFSPRCMMAPSCSKYLAHVGKCLHECGIHIGTGSRIPEIDSTTGLPMHNSIVLQQRLSQGGSYAMTSNLNFPTSGGGMRDSAAGRKKESGWDAWKARKSEMDDLDTPEKRQRLAMRRKEAQDTDIEYVAPFMPSLMDITETRLV
jgi:hypothetical protein